MHQTHDGLSTGVVLLLVKLYIKTKKDAGSTRRY
eukprot:SAG11_NODE_28494_length_321_cov_0.522523_1_plen_33_part_01